MEIQRDPTGYGKTRRPCVEVPKAIPVDQQMPTRERIVAFAPRTMSDHLDCHIRHHGRQFSADQRDASTGFG
ncbi:MAG: hypothetical protein ABI658_26245 [Acidimicrobiales bacterium]